MAIGITEAFDAVLNIIVQFYTGSYAILGVLVSMLFMFVLLARGVNFTFSFVLTAPLIGALTAGSWFGSATWGFNIVMLVLGIIYGFVIVRLFS